MRLIIGAVIVLDILEAVLHLVYGFGCWGAQPGGDFNMSIIEGLMMAFLCAAILALGSARRGKQLLIRAAAGTAGLILNIVVYGLGGWWLFTSAHDQGAENLIMFGALNLAVLMVLLALRIPDERSGGEQASS